MTGRACIGFFVASVMGVSAASFAGSDEGKEVTLKGTLECGKCSLKEASKCENVLQVKEGDKTTNYYLVDNKLSKDSHAAICRAPKDNVSVTGVVSEKDGKHWIMADKIEGLPAKG